jgi:hypothetical protein
MRPPLSKELWFGKEDKLVDGPEIKFDQWNGKDRSLFFEKEQVKFHKIISFLS